LLYKDFWGATPVYVAYFKKFFKLPVGLSDDIAKSICVHDAIFFRREMLLESLGFQLYRRSVLLSVLRRWA
jgi:hypothetical protein